MFCGNANAPATNRLKRFVVGATLAANLLRLVNNVDCRVGFLRGRFQQRLKPDLVT